MKKCCLILACVFFFFLVLYVLYVWYGWVDVMFFMGGPMRYGDWLDLFSGVLS